jgi:hypothetical protein
MWDPHVIGYPFPLSFFLYLLPNIVPQPLLVPTPSPTQPPPMPAPNPTTACARSQHAQRHTAMPQQALAPLCGIKRPPYGATDADEVT